MAQTPSSVLASAEMYLHDLQTRLEQSDDRAGLTVAHELELLRHFHSSVQACEHMLSPNKDASLLRKVRGLAHQFGEAQQALQNQLSAHQPTATCVLQLDTTSIQAALDKINSARGRAGTMPSLGYPSHGDGKKSMSHLTGYGGVSASVASDGNATSSGRGKRPPSNPAAMAAVRAQVEALHRSLLLERPPGSGAHAGKASGSSETSEEVQAEAGAIVQDMEKMVEALKEGGHALHDRLVKDNSMLDSTNEAAQANLDATAKANATLEAENRAQMLNLSATFGMLATVVLIFVGCYVGLKIFSKPPAYSWRSFPARTASMPTPTPGLDSDSAAGATEAEDLIPLQAHSLPAVTPAAATVGSSASAHAVNSDIWGQQSSGHGVDGNDSIVQLEVHADGAPALLSDLTIHHDVHVEKESNSSGAASELGLAETAPVMQHVDAWGAEGSGQPAHQRAGIGAEQAADNAAAVPEQQLAAQSSPLPGVDAHYQAQGETGPTAHPAAEQQRVHIEQEQVQAEASYGQQQAPENEATAGTTSSLEEVERIGAAGQDIPLPPQAEAALDQARDAGTTLAEPLSATPVSDLQPGEFQPYVHGLGLPDNVDDRPPPQVQGVEEGPAIVTGAGYPQGYYR